MHSIVDIIRKKIFGNTPIEFFIYFDTLYDEEQEFVFRIILSDYYKIVYNYDKEGLKLFKYDIKELLNFCNNDPDNFIRILSAAKAFYDLDKLSKCLLLESMEALGQDIKIASISKVHVLDKVVYALSDDLEMYKEYYKDYINKNKTDKEKKNKVIDFFAFKMLELKYENETKYKKNVLEFIKVYYKWKKFIKEHEGDHLLNSQDFKYLDIIENKTIDEILLILEDDIDFLISIIEEYMHYSTAKLEIPEKFINNYFDTECEKIKKKLNIK